MKKCLIFAFWVPQGMEPLGEYYIELIEKHFNSKDVYIGINCGTSQKLIDLIKTKFKNNIEVPKDKCMDSDASGYQFALSILDKKYDYVVFGHSKGASYNNIDASFSYRNYNELFFWDKINFMISHLEKDLTIGVIGIDYIYDHGGSPDYSILNTINDFPLKQYYSGFYANTFYLMRGNIIDFLVENKNINFFNKKLIDIGFNRYFFESHFPKISSMFGYKPAIIKNNKIKIV
jgi:hypothetical protein